MAESVAMRFLGIALGLILAVAAVLCGWQQLRYLNARRGPVQDRQTLLHSSSVFHVVSFLRASPNGDVIEELRKLRAELEGPGNAEMIYAGRAVLVALASEQLDRTTDWDAVVLVQYPSRASYDTIAASGEYRTALGRFAASYSHGMERSPLVNLAIPIGLLGLRGYQLLSGAPSIYPLVRAPQEMLDARGLDLETRLGRLDELRPLGEDAVVVVNLLKAGNAAQRAADRSYGLKMLGSFAEGGYGPMHMGRAVTIEGKAEFDNVAVVYYPGIDYTKALFSSTFFNEIVGDKQPGDTQAVITVPVLSLL